MRALLAFTAVSLAAITLPAAPAQADDVQTFGFVSGGWTSRVDSGSFGPGDGDRRHRRHHRDDGAVFIYDRDYQGDTAWRSDSFNDWWHDRPERAYPRWMLSNQNCDRRWYQGDVLTC